MDYNKTIDGGVCVVDMSGRFTFSDHVEFKALLDIYKDYQIKQVDLKLEGLEFVDSAALGLLLLARDAASDGNKKLRLIRPTSQVKKMFEISRFYDLFEIVD